METSLVASPARRIAEVVAFWAVWVGMGLAFHLEGNAYLLVGVPLTVLFQVVVRGKPISAMWVRDQPFGLGWRALAIALPLAAFELFLLVNSIRSHEWVPAAWTLCAVAGAFPAGFAFTRLGRTDWQNMAGCLAFAALGGAVFFLNFAAKIGFHFNALVALQSFLAYIAVCFVLEEVSFRGAIDAHLNPAGQWRWYMALVSSVLWALWHVPILLVASPTLGMPKESLGIIIAGAALGTLFSVAPYGMLFSYYYNRTGNLAVSATPHSLLDAVRNAIIP